MLANSEAIATVAVKDLAAARTFYEKTLGLRPSHEEGGEAVEYGSGPSKLLVYRSTYAGTNRATAVTWSAGDDIERLVQDLKSKGVRFEHYDLPGTTRKGDLHDAGSLKAAWFKDPDGNIHALVSG